MRDLIERMEPLTTSAVGGDGEAKRFLPLAAVQRLADEADLSVREVELQALKAQPLERLELIVRG